MSTSGVLLLALGVLAATAVSAQTEGTLAWPAPFTVDGFVTYSSAAISPVDSTIYVGVETPRQAGRIVAVTPQGAPRWASNRGLLPKPVDSSPAVGPDGTVYVGCVDGNLYALNGQTGEQKWARQTGGFVTSSPAIGTDGTIYVGSALGLTAGRLTAFSADGSVLWSFETQGVVDSSPAVAGDGTVYVGCDDRHLYAITPQGNEKWRYLTSGRIFSSPAIGADGTIYVGSADQKLYAITPEGALKWSFFSNGDIQSSPAIAADGTIYFGADVHLYALNPDGPDDFREKWKSDVRTTLASSPAVRADGTILVGGDDGKLRALYPDGRERWVYDTRTKAGDRIESSPLIAPDGSIYFGSEDGFLYKLHGNGSPLSTLSAWPAFRGNASHTGRARAITGDAHLVNLSARARASDAMPVLAGFHLAGGQQLKAALVRGIGPALRDLGVAAFMPDPRLELHGGIRIIVNDNWEDEGAFSSPAETAAGVGAFPLPRGSKDAAIARYLEPGSHSALVAPADGRPGVVLVEVYDAIAGDPATRLSNLSLRRQTDSGEDVLLLGFVVQGAGATRLLVRAVGPGLRQFGVSNVLMRPTMTLFHSDSTTVLGTNGGWSTLSQDIAVANRAAGAFTLEDGSADCALIAVLGEGSYTVQVSGANGTNGEVLAEVYVLP